MSAQAAVDGAVALPLAMGCSSMWGQKCGKKGMVVVVGGSYGNQVHTLKDVVPCSNNYGQPPRKDPQMGYSKIVRQSGRKYSDDEASYHEDASDNGTATNKPKQQQQQLTPTTTTISNIKLPILKKEEYDIWAMEMEHYLKKILPPVSAAEIHAVEKERKARTILLMAIPKEHLRRFHGMDDAKEIWEAIRTRFGGNANSKKMQKAVLKQQFEAFTISSSEGLEKGYDRFQQLLSQLEAHGAEVSTKDANHKFLRSLPPAWSNLAMTMRTKPDVDTLSIDDLYNNLRVFEQELTSTSKSSASAQNVAFVSHSKSSTNKVKSGHTGAYSTCTPTSSNNFQEREVPAGFADEIDDIDIEEMDNKLAVAMIAIRMKSPLQKTGRKSGLLKQLLGTNDGKKRDSFYQDQGARKKEQNQNCLLTMDDGVVNWGEHTVEEEETNHALMAISSNTETDNFKGVPHPLTGDYTPKPQEEIDDSLYLYGKKGPQKPEIRDSDDNSTEHSTCQSNDSEGSFGNPSKHSSESKSESISVPNEMSTSKSVITNEKVVSESKEVEPSCATHVKTPREQMKNQGTHEVKRKNWNEMMGRELGEGSNVNTVRPKQPVPTSNSNSFSPVRPQGNWGTAVKTSAGYNWRNTRPNSNCNSGSNFVRTDHPLKNMEDRGIFDSGCSGHMTGNKDHLDDFKECKGGSVTFGVNSGSGPVNTQHADQDDSDMPELTIFNKPQKG
ncbi:hypothetical protein Tco_1455801, partial [Tanacetum coccineum]